MLFNFMYVSKTYIFFFSIERHKTLDPKPTVASPATVSFAPTLAAAPLSPLAAASLGQLVKTTPSPLSLGLTPAFLRGSAAALFAANFKQFQAKTLSYKLRASTATPGGLKKDDRNKFSPY